MAVPSAAEQLHRQQSACAAGISAIGRASSRGILRKEQGRSFGTSGQVCHVRRSVVVCLRENRRDHRHGLSFSPPDPGHPRMSYTDEFCLRRVMISDKRLSLGGGNLVLRRLWQKELSLRVFAELMARRENSRVCSRTARPPLLTLGLCRRKNVRASYCRWVGLEGSKNSSARSVSFLPDTVDHIPTISSGTY